MSNFIVEPAASSRTLPGSIGGGRPVELLPMPVTLPRLRGALDRLTAQCAAERSVGHPAS